MRTQSAVLLYLGCVFFEIALAVERLAESHDVRYFTPHGEHHIGSNGAVLVSHGSYSSLAASSVACVLVPGGNPDSIVTDGLATERLVAARERGAIMAGICAGNLVLASAGVLRGKRATHNYTVEYAPPEIVAVTAPLWEGIVFDRADVVADDGVITAQPWAYVELAAIVAQELGILSASKADKYIAYHRRTNESAYPLSGPTANVEGSGRR